MDYESWTKSQCPKCKSVNWICDTFNDGDPNKLDPEGCVCWRCQEEYPLDEKFLIEFYGKDWEEQSIEWAYGKEKPE